jgi:hypothetical protein
MISSPANALYNLTDSFKNEKPELKAFQRSGVVQARFVAVNSTFRASHEILIFLHDINLQFE